MILRALGLFQKFLGQSSVPKCGSASVDSQVAALFRLIELKFMKKESERFRLWERKKKNASASCARLH